MDRIIPRLGLALLSALLGCGARSGLGVDDIASDSSTDTGARDATERDTFAFDSGHETTMADDDIDTAIDSALDTPSVSADTPDALSLGAANEFTVVSTDSDVLVGGLFGSESGTKRLSFEGNILDHHAVFASPAGVLFGGVYVAAAHDVRAAVTWEVSLATGVGTCRFRALAPDGSGVGPIVDVPAETCVSPHVRAGGFDLITQAKRFGAVALTTLDASGAFVASGPPLSAEAFESRAIFADDSFTMAWSSATGPDDITQRVLHASAAGVERGDHGIISFHNTTEGSPLAIRLVDVGGGRVLTLALRHEKGYQPTLWTEAVLFDGGSLPTTERRLDTDAHLDGLSATSSRGDVVVAWTTSPTSTSSSAASLKVQRLAPDGEPRGSAVVVATTPRPPDHVEITSTPTGALVLYTSAGDLFAVPIAW